jgi:UDP-N-acetylmuramoylalanine--D-glutamate ligase
MMSLSGKKVTVAGLGKFGGNIAAARWLVEQGAKVLITDQQPAEKLQSSMEQLAGLAIEWRLGNQIVEDFAEADLVVASPAIAPTNPLLAAAERAGVSVTTEIVLFAERCAARVIAVTGTKGKSTTTALLGEMLKTRMTTYVGGNLGVSLLPILPKITPTDVVVLELSSFMLHYLGVRKWSPHIAVVTMLAADHLDWHGNTETYLDAKRQILAHQTASNFAVLNSRCPRSKAWAETCAAKVVWFNTDVDKPIELAIPGAHNQQNAQAAFAAAHLLGVTWEEAQQAVRSFRGLPHRLALVHEANGVRFYDDSIATIPQAAVAALEAFPSERVIQIVGGFDKGLEFGEMCKALRERAKAVLCIGATGESIAEGVSSPKARRCWKLEEAMAVAKEMARPGDVVLLSTGCASYDQFDNFQQRGEMFARLARMG